jgi:hypothetical protein
MNSPGYGVFIGGGAASNAPAPTRLWNSPKLSPGGKPVHLAVVEDSAPVVAPRRPARPGEIGIGRFGRVITWVTRAQLGAAARALGGLDLVDAQFWLPPDLADQASRVLAQEAALRSACTAAFHFALGGCALTFLPRCSTRWWARAACATVVFSWALHRGTAADEVCGPLRLDHGHWVHDEDRATGMHGSRSSLGSSSTPI